MPRKSKRAPEAVYLLGGPRDKTVTEVSNSAVTEIIPGKQNPFNTGSYIRTRAAAEFTVFEWRKPGVTGKLD